MWGIIKKMTFIFLSYFTLKYVDFNREKLPSDSPGAAHLTAASLTVTNTVNYTEITVKTPVQSVNVTDKKQM